MTGQAFALFIIAIAVVTGLTILGGWLLYKLRNEVDVEFIAFFGGMIWVTAAGCMLAALFDGLQHWR